MPRKATKACQTDYVFLSEQQVQNIVDQRVGQLEDEIKSLKTLGSRATDEQFKTEILEILAPNLNQLKTSIESIQEEMGQLTTNCEKLANDLDLLNNLQQSTEVLVEQLDGRMDSAEQYAQRIEDRMFESNENNHAMQTKVDDIDQQIKSRNLRFFGLEEEEGEDPTEKIKDFVQKQMNIKISSTEIEATRVGKLHPSRTKPRDILVKFDSGVLRNAIYQKKTILRQLNQNVFINEDLTTKRSHLFFEARKMRKQQKLFGVWTQAGNVLIKVNPNSNPKAVSNLEEIKSLINDNPSNESDTDIETTSFDDAL